MTPTKTKQPTITIPAGATIRQTPRGKTKQENISLPENLTIPRDKVTLAFSEHTMRPVVGFQYKGRKATILFSRVFINGQ